MPPQAKGEGSTRSLNRKAINEAVEKGLSKNICKLILKGDKMNLNLFLHNPVLYKMIINFGMFSMSMKDRICR
jgi:hypothetical protein